MIKFKKPEDEADFQKLAPRLKKVVDFMVAYADTVLDRVLTVTSIVRDDDSTHKQLAPYRFIDIRSQDFARGQATKLRVVVNLVFPYGKRNDGKIGETIIPLDHSDTSPGFTGEHFHIQISSRDHFG